MIPNRHVLNPVLCLFRSLLYFAQLHSSIIIVLKASLKWVPIVGPAMQMFRFIFMQRNWNTDKHNLGRMLMKFGQQASLSFDPFVLLFCTYDYAGTDYDIKLNGGTLMLPCISFFASSGRYTSIAANTPNLRQICRKSWHQRLCLYSASSVNRAVILSTLAVPSRHYPPPPGRHNSLPGDTARWIRARLLYAAIDIW